MFDIIIKKVGCRDSKLFDPFSIALHSVISRRSLSLDPVIGRLKGSLGVGLFRVMV